MTEGGFKTSRKVEQNHSQKYYAKWYYLWGWEYSQTSSVITSEKFYKESDGVKSASVRLQGKIIYVDVAMNDDKTNEDIQNIATTSLGKLTDEQKGYYDIQFIFTREKYNPYFGSKAHSNTVISWANFKYDETTTTTTTKKKK